MELFLALKVEFDCIHFGIVFVFPNQCEFGHAIIITATLMGFGYILFFINAATGEFKCVEARKSDISNFPDELS